MAIIKNEIPILEFDTEQTAVLNPTHEMIQSRQQFLIPLMKILV